MWTVDSSVQCKFLQLHSDSLTTASKSLNWARRIVTGTPLKSAIPYRSNNDMFSSGGLSSVQIISAFASWQLNTSTVLPLNPILWITSSQIANCKFSGWPKQNCLPIYIQTEIFWNFWVNGKIWQAFFEQDLTWNARTLNHLQDCAHSGIAHGAHYKRRAFCTLPTVK